MCYPLPGLVKKKLEITWEWSSWGTTQQNTDGNLYATVYSCMLSWRVRLYDMIHNMSTSVLLLLWCKSRNIQYIHTCPMGLPPPVVPQVISTNASFPQPTSHTSHLSAHLFLSFVYDTCVCCPLRLWLPWQFSWNDIRLSLEINYQGREKPTEHKISCRLFFIQFTLSLSIEQWRTTVK